MRVKISDFSESIENVSPGTYHVMVGKEPTKEIIPFIRLLTSLKRQEIDLIVTGDENATSNWLGSSFPEPVSKEYRGGFLTLSTSGTTGQPKKVLRHIPLEDQRRLKKSRNWVLCYPLDKWSGISTILEAIRSGSDLVIPNRFSLESISEAISETNEASISLTPSLFKSLVLKNHESAQFENVNQVTFGGEYVNQRTLDIARKIYPNARITHIYASSELGDFLIDSSGQEGYSLLHAQNRGAELAEDGELVVGKVHTGDLWELVDERIHFIGRSAEIINVGGNKVSPTHLAKVTLSIDGVQDALFYSIPNPLLGSVVGLKFIGSLDPKELKSILRNLLPKFAVPMSIEKVPEINLEKNMKRRVINLE